MADYTDRVWTIVKPDDSPQPHGTRVYLGDREIPGVTAVHVDLAVGDVARITLEIVCGDGLIMRQPDPKQD